MRAQQLLGWAGGARISRIEEAVTPHHIAALSLLFPPPLHIRPQHARPPVHAASNGSPVSAVRGPGRLPRSIAAAKPHACEAGNARHAALSSLWRVGLEVAGGKGGEAISPLPWPLAPVPSRAAARPSSVTPSLPLEAPKPAAAGGGNRQAERGESQGALARLCEFHGMGDHPKGRQKECRCASPSASSANHSTGSPLCWAPPRPPKSLPLPAAAGLPSVASAQKPSPMGKVSSPLAATDEVPRRSAS